MSLSSTLQALATRIGTEFKTLRNSEIGDRSTLTTTAKTVVGALNEVNAKPTSTGGAAINDTTPSTTTVYSSSKTNSVAAAAAQALIADGTTSATTVYSSTKVAQAIAQAKADLVGSASAALDTFGEVAAQLANDETAATALTTAVGNRVRFDTTQTLTSGQATQLVSNLYAAGIARDSDLQALKTAVGDTTVDAVAAFNAALV